MDFTINSVAVYGCHDIHDLRTRDLPLGPDRKARLGRKDCTDRGADSAHGVRQLLLRKLRTARARIARDLPGLSILIDADAAPIRADDTGQFSHGFSTTPVIVSVAASCGSFCRSRTRRCISGGRRWLYLCRRTVVSAAVIATVAAPHSLLERK